MADTQIVDGADLWFPAEVEIVEAIRFIDRRYLGVITVRPSTNVFYASLMRKAQADGDMYVRPTWVAHTLHEGMTDSVSHAKDMVMAAYEALDDRLATNS